MQNQPRSTDPEWTIIKLLKWTTSYFESHDIAGPRIEAEIILAHVLQVQRIDLYLQYDQPLSSNELSQFKKLIKRRINKEPVAYIVGSKEFWSMDFMVTKDVLIPRPETEFLVEAAINLLPRNSASNGILIPKRILDLGTGSGAVVLALASMRPEHFFFASDRKTAAVKLAKQNAKHHGVNSSVGFICADWFEAFKDRWSIFDMIVSNPPYIPSRVIGKLQPEIVKYEPISAIDGGEDGLSCLKHIINNAHFYLQQKGHLLLEIGHDQKNDVQKIVDQCAKYENVVYTKDYSGYDRIVQMRKRQ
jgi:release factor glutamine methyltransferase